MNNTENGPSARPPYKRKVRNYLLDVGLQLRYTATIVIVAVFLTAGLGFKMYQATRDVSKVILWTSLVDPSSAEELQAQFSNSDRVVLWGIVGFGVASLAPLYAEDRYHLAPLSAGTLLAARGVGAIVIGAAAAMALRRTGYRLPLAAGFIVVAVGTVAMAISPRLGLSPYVWLSIGAGLTGLGNGLANPASRNACLQVAPNEVAALTGLRQMFVFMGIIFSVSTVTAILNRSADPGIAQAHILWVVAGVLLVVMVPLVFRVPEHKGSW